MTEDDTMTLPDTARLSFPVRDRQTENTASRRAVETTLDVIAENETAIGTIVTLVDHDLVGKVPQTHVTAVAEVHGRTGIFSGHGAADKAKAFALGIHAAATDRVMAVD